MGRDRIRRVALCLGALLLAACGAAAQSRPRLLSSWPAQADVVAGPLQEIRLTYDEPVEVLNAGDVRVFGRDTGQIGVRVERRAGDVESIFVRPADAAAFPLDEDLIVQVHEGAVVNVLRHYADEPYEIAFTTGLEPPLLLGRPGQVTLVDPASFGGLGDVPTPGGRDPVGILATVRGAVERVWVQLASGGGAGASLAWFSPGDGAMTPVTLTTGADLTAAWSALALSADGLSLYGAWRDTGSGGVRLARVSTLTGLETGSLLLASVASGPATEAVDLAFSQDGTRLVVCAQEAAGGRLAYVDEATLTELDRDAGTVGVQGHALPLGAGRLGTADGRVWVARPGTGDLESVTDAGVVTTHAGTATGTTRALWTSPDHGMLVQGLTGYVAALGLQTRNAGDGFGTPATVAIDDDVGGVDRMANAVLDLAPLPGRARCGALLDSAGGLLLAVVDYVAYRLDGEDLDPLTAGIQAADLESVASGATVLGRTVGAFSP